MTPNEARQRVADAYRLLLGRNIYSQEVNKRECAFVPYKDGKYYSDCSSSVRLAYKQANVGFPNIGGNTVAQINNKNGVRIDCGMKNGIPTDIGKLRVGDLLLYAGNDKSRVAAEYVGHVEMVYAIKGTSVTLCGHGSGNPSTKDMATYCRNRQNAKSTTPRGNQGLICVKRFILDDASMPGTPVGDGNVALGSRMLRYGMIGNDVKELQTQLKKLGYFGGTPAGNYLDITQDAVQRFQKANKLAVDGIYGPKSHAALQTLLTGSTQPQTPSQPQRVVIAGGNCWVRKEPLTGGKIDVAYKGQEYLFTGVTKLGWPKIKIGNKEGYASPKFAKIKA